MKKLLIPAIIIILSQAILAIPDITIENVDVAESTFGHDLVVNVDVINRGDTPSQSFLMEIQPKPSGTLSVYLWADKTCNPSTPQNQHVTVPPLFANEKGRLHWTVNGLEGGKTYDVIGVSVNQCCSLPGGCFATQPFGWGQKIGSVFIGGTEKAICGDGSCQATENVLSCSADCDAWTGDSTCSSGENWETEPSCPKPPAAQESRSGEQPEKIMKSCSLANINACSGSFRFAGVILLAGMTGGVVLLLRKLRL